MYCYIKKVLTIGMIIGISSSVSFAEEAGGVLLDPGVKSIIDVTWENPDEGMPVYVVFPEKIVEVSGYYVDGVKQCDTGINKFQYGDKCYEYRCPSGTFSNGDVCQSDTEKCIGQENYCDFGDLNEKTLQCEVTTQCQDGYKEATDGKCEGLYVRNPDSVSDLTTQKNIADLTEQHLEGSKIFYTEKVCSGTLINGDTCIDESSTTNPICNEGTYDGSQCKIINTVKINAKIVSKNFKCKATKGYVGKTYSYVYETIIPPQRGCSFYRDYYFSYGFFINMYNRLFIGVCSDCKGYIKTGSYHGHTKGEWFNADGKWHNLGWASGLRSIKIEKIGEKSYSCDNGYTLSGTTCVKKIVSYEAVSNNTVTCPSGYLLYNNKCTKKLSYSCPSGYRDNGKTGNQACEQTRYCANDDTFEEIDGKWVCTHPIYVKIPCPTGFVYDEHIDTCVKNSSYKCK